MQTADLRIVARVFRPEGSCRKASFLSTSISGSRKSKKGCVENNTVWALAESNKLGERFYGAPMAERMAEAMPSDQRRTSSSRSASTMTRASGSVPE